MKKKSNYLVEHVDSSIQNINYSKSNTYNFIKRVIDITGSIIGLIVFTPVFLIVGILIKLEDPKGSILFTQYRYGIYPNTFKMYKFRSMIHGAEEGLKDLKDLNEQDGPAFKMKNDPRITRIGKIIRKTSLDELPQLFNVLQGDMSLVGPRPAIPSEVEEYTKYQMQRLLVKPGITCIWQVKGRNKVTFDEWIEMDIEYIKNRSILLDIKLILKTVKLLFGDKNAF